MFTFHRLHNGLAVILAPQKSATTVTVIVGTRVGSRMETPEIAGISHFFEHMMFKGTAKRPTTRHISKELDSVGAEYNAYTSKDVTAYYVKASSHRLKLALDVLSDMVLSSKLSAAEIERERGVILEEKKMYEDNPLLSVEDLCEQLVYQGNPLGDTVIGTEKSIREVQRKDFFNFRKKYYRGENMCLVVAGKVDAKTLSLVKKYFDPLPGSGGRVQPEFTPFHFDQNDARVRISHKKSDQIQMGIGLPAYAHHDERMPALQLLSIMLGGNMSSRLFIQVRERRGLAYSVHSSVSPYQDSGNVYVQVGLDASKVSEAISVIRKEMESLKEKNVPPLELQQAKDYVQGTMDLQLEDTINLAGWYFRQELFLGKALTPEQKLRRIMKVTAREIREVANDVFQFRRASLALIGNVKSEDVYKKLFE